MNNDNVAAVRNAYAVAERKDLEGWINLFTPDGCSPTIRWARPTVAAPSPTRSATTARRFPACTASYIASAAHNRTSARLRRRRVFTHRPRNDDIGGHLSPSE